ncbi:cell wall synthesis protein CwsA [Tsukamurella strandjordii]|uniref:cell wall synthesis protein CwsA n=1 Tax=Tsukamurella TaxID=2060 RepID=UPI001C7CA771|nr:cell wall synthesis protein CwsA [Tsukamurella sp. TY48]GIZ97197.1 hypothetical protein TTY48_18090 [Tsukamurella sp. TY48]
MATPLLDDVQATDESSHAPTNAQRVATGFGQSFTGPLNIARGLTGIGLSIATRVLTTFFSVTRKTIALALAKKVVRKVRSSDEAPLALVDDAAPSGTAKGGTRKPLLITLVVALVLAVGGTAFKLLRTPKAPPIAAEPPRVRPASGATGDSAPIAEEEPAVVAVDEDPRKIGE